MEISICTDAWNMGWIGVEGLIQHKYKIWKMCKHLFQYLLLWFSFYFNYTLKANKFYRYLWRKCVIVCTWLSHIPHTNIFVWWSCTNSLWFARRQLQNAWRTWPTNNSQNNVQRCSKNTIPKRFVIDIAFILNLFCFVS